MNVEKHIQNKVLQAFISLHFELMNESHLHNVPVNSETHFKMVLVSDDFEGVSKVARHQKIYQLLADELAEGVHALALHLYTSEEWHSKNKISPNSPQCLGGSKK